MTPLGHPSRFGYDRRRPMPPRFCSRCGAAVVPDARFCAQCGAPLAGAPAAATPGWQPSGLGAAVLGLFLIAGLGVWTAILSPAPPRPGPQGPAAAAGPAGAPAASKGPTPQGQARVVELPAEVKTFIADLEKKTRDQPEDISAWMKLAQVNSRAAQLDPSYSSAALSAFKHVLERQPENVDALRGLANVHYDRNEHREAIPIYERYLAARPDDPSARTDLGTMYLSAGDLRRAVETYREVVRRSPHFLQAHYNLAIAHHRQGDDAAALAELQTARGLAPDDEVRRQIDEMIAALRGEAPPRPSSPAPEAASAPGSPFQSAVETAFRGHSIMGPRIVRFEWTGAGAGRVVVREFPMEAMPDDVRGKFLVRLGDELRSARTSHPVEGPVRVEIADLASGTVMATVTPEGRPAAE
jgi:cytochrome c-type biogenesis protein CcmH/NrfG